MSQKKNTITRILHWLFACFVFLMLSIGFYMTNTEYSLTVYEWHKSLGVLFFFVIGIRIFWSFKYPWQSSTVLKKNETLAREIIHKLLIVLLFFMPLTGFLSSAYSGWGVRPFDFITIVPQNLDQAGKVEPYNASMYEFVKLSHKVLAYLFSSLIILHILAVLKHHFIDKDTTLIDMLRNKSD